MKKILLSIWLVIAVAVFIAGMIVLFLIKDFTIYLLWSAGCTVPCLLYLFYDYFANHGGGFIIYFILSVLLGTVILM